MRNWQFTFKHIMMLNGMMMVGAICYHKNHIVSHRFYCMRRKGCSHHRDIRAPSEVLRLYYICSVVVRGNI